MSGPQFTFHNTTPETFQARLGALPGMPDDQGSSSSSSAQPGSRMTGRVRPRDADEHQVAPAKQKARRHNTQTLSDVRAIAEKSMRDAIKVATKDSLALGLDYKGHDLYGHMKRFSDGFRGLLSDLKKATEYTRGKRVARTDEHGVPDVKLIHALATRCRDVIRDAVDAAPDVQTIGVSHGVFGLVMADAVTNSRPTKESAARVFTTIREVVSILYDARDNAQQKRASLLHAGDRAVGEVIRITNNGLDDIATTFNGFANSDVLTEDDIDRVLVGFLNNKGLTDPRLKAHIDSYDNITSSNLPQEMSALATVIGVRSAYPDIDDIPSDLLETASFRISRAVPGFDAKKYMPRDDDSGSYTQFFNELSKALMVIAKGSEFERVMPKMREVFNDLTRNTGSTMQMMQQDVRVSNAKILYDAVLSSDDATALKRFENDEMGVLTKHMALIVDYICAGRVQPPTVGEPIERDLLLDQYRESVQNDSVIGVIMSAFNKRFGSDRSLGSSILNQLIETKTKEAFIARNASLYVSEMVTRTGMEAATHAVQLERIQKNAEKALGDVSHSLTLLSANVAFQAEAVRDNAGEVGKMGASVSQAINTSIDAVNIANSELAKQIKLFDRSASNIAGVIGNKVRADLQVTERGIKTQAASIRQLTETLTEKLRHAEATPELLRVAMDDIQNKIFDLSNVINTTMDGQIQRAINVSGQKMMLATSDMLNKAGTLSERFAQEFIVNLNKWTAILGSDGPVPANDEGEFGVSLEARRGFNRMIDGIGEAVATSLARSSNSPMGAGRQSSVIGDMLLDAMTQAIGNYSYDHSSKTMVPKTAETVQFEQMLSEKFERGRRAFDIAFNAFYSEVESFQDINGTIPAIVSKMRRIKTAMDNAKSNSAVINPELRREIMSEMKQVVFALDSTYPNAKVQEYIKRTDDELQASIAVVKNSLPSVQDFRVMAESFRKAVNTDVASLSNEMVDTIKELMRDRFVSDNQGMNERLQRTLRKVHSVDEAIRNTLVDANADVSALNGALDAYSSANNASVSMDHMDVGLEANLFRAYSDANKAYINVVGRFEALESGRVQVEKALFKMLGDDLKSYARESKTSSEKIQQLSERVNHLVETVEEKERRIVKLVDDAREKQQANDDRIKDLQERSDAQIKRLQDETASKFEQLADLSRGASNSTVYARVAAAAEETIEKLHVHDRVAPAQITDMIASMTDAIDALQSTGFGSDTDEYKIVMEETNRIMNARAQLESISRDFGTAVDHHEIAIKEALQATGRVAEKMSSTTEHDAYAQSIANATHAIEYIKANANLQEVVRRASDDVYNTRIGRMKSAVELSTEVASGVSKFAKSVGGVVKDAAGLASNVERLKFTNSMLEGRIESEKRAMEQQRAHKAALAELNARKAASDAEAASIQKTERMKQKQKRDEENEARMQRLHEVSNEKERRITELKGKIDRMKQKEQSAKTLAELEEAEKKKQELLQARAINDSLSSGSNDPLDNPVMAKSYALMLERKLRESQKYNNAMIQGALSSQFGSLEGLDHEAVRKRLVELEALTAQAHQRSFIIESAVNSIQNDGPERFNDILDVTARQIAASEKGARSISDIKEELCASGSHLRRYMMEHLPTLLGDRKSEELDRMRSLFEDGSANDIMTAFGRFSDEKRGRPSMPVMSPSSATVASHYAAQSALSGRVLEPQLRSALKIAYSGYDNLQSAMGEFIESSARDNAVSGISSASLETYANAYALALIHSSSKHDVRKRDNANAFPILRSNRGKLIISDRSTAALLKLLIGSNIIDSDKARLFTFTEDANIEMKRVARDISPRRLSSIVEYLIRSVVSGVVLTKNPGAKSAMDNTKTALGGLRDVLSLIFVENDDDRANTTKATALHILETSGNELSSAVRNRLEHISMDRLKLGVRDEEDAADAIISEIVDRYSLTLDESHVSDAVDEAMQSDEDEDMSEDEIMSNLSAADDDTIALASVVARSPASGFDARLYASASSSSVDDNKKDGNAPSSDDGSNSQSGKDDADADIDIVDDDIEDSSSGGSGGGGPPGGGGPGGSGSGGGGSGGGGGDRNPGRPSENNRSGGSGGLYFSSRIFCHF